MIHQNHLGLTFHGGDLLDLEKFAQARFGLGDKAIIRAQRRAVNKVARWFRTHLLRGIGQLTGLPQKAMRARFRLALAKAGSEENSSHIWFGIDGIDPMKLGLKGRPSGSGYRVGKHFFEGAFRAFHVNHPNSSRVGLYRRKNRKRIPIIRQMIPIDEQADLVVERLVERGQSRLVTVLRQELEFEQKKAQGLI